MTQNAMPANDDDKGSVKVLNKALAILEAIGTSPRPLRITEVAVAVGISRPTAYRIVNTLIADGFVSQDQFGRLSIGMSILALTSSLLDSNRLRIEAMPHLQALATLTGERANLGIMHRNRVLYLAGVEKPSLPTIYTRFGKTAPAHCSSLGKTLLAYMSQAEVMRIISAEPLTASTQHSITTVQHLNEELATTRARGFGIDQQEHVLNSCCIAAPIFSGGKIIGAMGISASTDKIEPLLEFVKVLQHTAEVVSHRLEVSVSA